MKLNMLLASAAFAAAAISAPLAAHAVTYDFNAPGNYSGFFTLDVVSGQALSGTGTIDVAGYAPEALTLITPSTPGIESPLGYRANDGTDLFGVDTSVPIDSNGILFAIGPNAPAPGQDALVTFYSTGAGAYSAALFGHVVAGGNEFYQNNGVPTSLTATSAAPEPGTWALMFGGLAMIGGMLRIAHARRREAEVAGIATA